MLRRRGALCVQCLALAAAVVAAVFTGAAFAQTTVGPAAEISAEVWLGLFSTILFGLIAGYAKGLERRVAALEHDQKQQQTQIGLIRETFAREHPSRVETEQHRQFVEKMLATMQETHRASMERLERRLDELMRGSR